LRRLKGLLLLAALLVGPSLPAAEEKKAEPDPWRRALERSLLFPGLGQLGEKQYVKAAVFASAEIFCLAQAFIQAGRGNDAYRGYRDARDAASATEWRLRTAACDRRRNTALLAAAGVWVCNMIDMFAFARKKYGPKAAVAFHPFYDHEHQAFGTGITCRF
jgi:Family of unknown function (DUF5683)